MVDMVTIMWFKRDLRLFDQAPLAAALDAGRPVIPLYIVEPGYWCQPFAARRHWHFIHDCLTELRADCAALGQPLVVRIGDAVAVLTALAQTYRIAAIHAHEETGNGWTYERDLGVQGWCRQQGIALHEWPANGVVRRLPSRDQWARQRNARMAAALIAKPTRLLPVTGLDPGVIPAKDSPLFGAAVPGITQPGGRRAGVACLTHFLNKSGARYIYSLSAPGPAEQHCSRLSPHLAWGSLSVREVVKATAARRAQLDAELCPDEYQAWSRNLSAFQSRLSWRCHFVQKIEDRPAIEFRCMHQGCEAMRPRHGDPHRYQAWAAGRTGYPLIDACMRALVHDGWLTFRMRAMLVSFASYHLWLDWRETGHHLARQFTDYEPGIHYSQLQMHSGVTGINSLRIYNPIKQSLDHDPDGTFIRRWVPELAAVPTSWIHQPWTMDAGLQQAAGCRIGDDYPAPIIDHQQAVRAARAAVAAIRKTDGFRAEAGRVYQQLGSRKRQTPRRKTGARQTEKPQSQLRLF